MVSRFEVYLVNLDPQVSDDPKNTRPCVIVSPDEMNRYLSTVIIAPVSSPSAGYPTRVSTLFLNGDRSVVLDQLRAVDSRRLVKKIGEIDVETRSAVLATLAEMFAD